LTAPAEPLLAFTQRFLGDLPLRDVAGDLGKLEELARIVAQRIDDHARPELAAALAHPPALVLEFAFFEGGSQRKRRPTGNAVMFCVKHGKVLAEDFAGRIALEAFGAGIPG
jgi:hypothetical protein